MSPLREKSPAPKSGSQSPLAPSPARCGRRRCPANEWRSEIASQRGRSPPPTIPGQKAPFDETACLVIRTSTMVSFAFFAMVAEKLFAAYLNTQFPTSSTFHARTSATSPAMAGSRMNRRPLNSRASFLIPGMATPALCPPSFRRRGIEPSSTAVEAPVGVQIAGKPDACACSLPTNVPCGMSSSEILPSR